MVGVLVSNENCIYIFYIRPCFIKRGTQSARAFTGVNKNIDAGST